MWPGTSKLIEEAGELQQVLGKLIGNHGNTDHFDGSDLRVRLLEEIADLRAAIVFFGNMNLTGEERSTIQNRTDAKLELFKKWHTEGK